MSAIEVVRQRHSPSHLVEAGGVQVQKNGHERSFFDGGGMSRRRRHVPGSRGPSYRCALFTASSISDRKSVVQGKSVSVRVDLGGRRIIKKTTHTETKCRRA